MKHPLFNMPKVLCTDIPTLDKDAVNNLLGGIYEKSEWVLNEARDGKGKERFNDACKNLTSLSSLLREMVDTASYDMKLALIKAHPDLAGKAALAGDLTQESTDEQKRAGLNSLTPDEMTKFTNYNEAYKTKFDFPFILAVRNARYVIYVMNCEISMRVLL